MSGILFPTPCDPDVNVSMHILRLRWFDYLAMFETPEGREQLADAFVACAIRHDIDVDITYE